ncbi:hypothetical protein Tco_0548283 [Tanacetum coccineum]
MITARKRVRPLPTHHLAMIHLVDYSSLDHFSSDDSSRDSLLSSLSDSSVDALSDSASSHSSSDHLLSAPSSGMRPSHHLCSLVLSVHRSSAAISDRPSHDSSSASLSRKRSRSPTASVPLSLPIPGTLSSTCTGLLPSPKRIRSPELVTDLEIDIDPEIQAEINECVTYADALRDRGIDARVVVEAIYREEIKTGARGPIKEERAVEVTYESLGDLVQRFHDHTKEIPVHHVQAIKSVQRDQGHKIVATGEQSADMLERIHELERDNMRLRDMMDVASQRVARSWRRKLRVQREMRQIWHFRFYDRKRIARLEACAMRHLDYHS